MDNIEMIPTYELFPHLQNPRKELGDLEELVDSIKANGVLQNLTVVPRDGGGYTVIIGNRRLAAARRAGLTELPCAVVFMTEEEQFKTMMVENMQRSDLTTIEQADGFQYMLDLGESMDTITQTTGFSRSTISRRLKLRELDRSKLQQAEGRGGTISDYMELFKIEDEGKRNEVLETIGTSDFRNTLEKAYDAQETEKNRRAVLAVVKTFAEKFPANEQRWSSKFQKILTYTYDSKKHSDLEPIKNEFEKYYYADGFGCVDIYKLVENKPTEKKKQQEGEQEQETDRAFDEYLEWYKVRKGEIDAMAKRHAQLRRTFWESISERKLEQNENRKALITFAAQLMSGFCIPLTGNIYGIPDFLEAVMGWGDQPNLINEGDREEYATKIAREPLKYLLLEAVSQFECNSQPKQIYDEKFVTCRNQHGYQCIYQFSFSKDFVNYRKMAALYRLLESLGYEVSSEEQSVLDGSYFEHINDDAPALPELQKGAYAIMDENGHWSEGTEDE